jgi:hypothetical protein
MLRNPDAAKKVNDLMLHISQRLDDSVAVAQATCSEEEFKEYRLAVAKIMGEILLSVLNPLYGTHPSLKPPDFE